MMKKSKNEELLNLVRAAKTGDLRAIKSIYDLYNDKIVRYCYHLTRNSSLAEDLSQDTFVKVFESIKHLKSEEAFNSWIYLIAKRRFLDHIRSKSNTEHLNFDETYDIGADDKSVELLNVINKALDNLDPSEKEAILLVDLGGNSYEDAALVVEMPLENFKGKIRYARKKFIEYCEQNNAEITGIFVIPEKKTG